MEGEAPPFIKEGGLPLQFKDDYFIFADIDSRDNEYYIVSTSSASTEYDFGLKTQINSEKGVGQVPTFISREDDTFDIELQITKLRGGQVPVAMDESDKRYLARWLFKDRPHPLCIDGMVFYVVAKSSKRWFNPADQGYVTITFQSCSPYAYSPIKTNWETFTNSYEVELENYGTVSDYEYLDIGLNKLDNATWIEITNEDLCETIRLEGLTSEDVRIDILGEELKYIENLYHKDKNMRKLLVEGKEDFPRLCYGKNKLTITSDGEWSCQLRFQEKQTLI